jgi:hypothetical protein
MRNQRNGNRNDRVAFFRHGSSRRPAYFLPSRSTACPGLPIWL